MFAFVIALSVVLGTTLITLRTPLRTLVSRRQVTVLGSIVNADLFPMGIGETVVLVIQIFMTSLTKFLRGMIRLILSLTARS